LSVLSFDISGSQIDGARDYQEDAFLITHLGDADTDSAGSMVIVADGMGGHAAGNVASNMAVQTFNRHLSKNFPNENISNVLYEAVLQANGSITATVSETAALKGMGCTLVACVLERGQLRWVSVGDSHLYLLRGGELVKKNADHSYGGFLDRMAEAGTPVEAEAGFSRNMLMSALTGDDIAEIDCPESALQLKRGDRVILSSDGLDTLDKQQIIDICKSQPAPKGCVDALLKAVNDAGAPRQDNTTVIVIDVIEKSEMAVEAPPAPPPRVEAAPPPPPSPRAARTSQPVEVEAPRKRSFGMLAALLLLVVAAGGGGAYWYLTQAPGKHRLPGSNSHESEPVDTGKNAAEVADTDIVPAGTSEPKATTPLATTDESQTTTVTPPPATPAKHGQFRDGLRGGGQGPLMTWVPAGSFTMGNPLAMTADERPEHGVTLKSFAIGVNEITVGDYRKFAQATGTKMPKLGPLAEQNDVPITFVSWNDALAYAKWLSQQTGKEYSLPSEAQWEYAARAGTSTAYWWGRAVGRGNAHCFACDTGLDPRQPTAVGRFKPNPFGLYDTSGNVQEWVYDCFHSSYEGAPTDGSVFEGGDCSVRVLRGGGYGSGPDKLTNSARDKLRVERGNDQSGLRVVRRN
jgi:formylglycine-generating enzyme required for sulfatase activity/serine/threonine protein phosphatase PrpC